MDRLTAFVTENEMKINPQKSKIMVFNPNKKYDFHPTVTTDTGTTLDIEEEFKLLGVTRKTLYSVTTHTKLQTSFLIFKF